MVYKGHSLIPCRAPARMCRSPFAIETRRPPRWPRPPPACCCCTAASGCWPSASRRVASRQDAGTWTRTCCRCSDGELGMSPGQNIQQLVSLGAKAWVRSLIPCDSRSKAQRDAKGNDGCLVSFSPSPKGVKIGMSNPARVPFLQEPWKADCAFASLLLCLRQASASLLMLVRLQARNSRSINSCGYGFGLPFARIVSLVQSK